MKEEDFITESDKIIAKAGHNELLLRKRQELDLFELAESIKRMIKVDKKTPKEIGEELGYGKREIYRFLKILDCDKDTKNKIKKGQISADKVSRIIYSLKDESKPNVKKMVGIAIREKLNVVELEDRIAEENDKNKYSEHLNQELLKFSGRIHRYIEKPPRSIRKFGNNIKVNAKFIIEQLEDIIYFVNNKKKRVKK